MSVKLFLFFSLTMLLQNNFEVKKQNSNVTGKVSFTLAGLFSYFINYKNGKRLLYIINLMAMLTMQGMLIYLVFNGMKQNETGVKQLTVKRERANLFGSLEAKGDFISAKGLGDIFAHGDSQWKGRCNYLDNMGFNVKNTYKKLPWYMDFRDTTQNRTSVVYPCTLRRYLDELLQNNAEVDLMKHEWARIASYRQFPIDSPARPVRLAQTGFYYRGSKDIVACFSCNLEYGDWKEEDIPSEIHKRLSPQCRFLTGEDSSNIPIHENRGPVDTNESQPVREEERGAAASVTDLARNSLETVTSSPVHVKQQSLFAEKEDFSYRKEGAKHPDYADVKRRFESFKEWPCSHLISPKSLVEAGFVYAGFGDCVRCFFCGIGLRNWEIGDEPWAEHARWSQNCHYVLEKKGIPYVKSHLNQTDEPYSEPSASAPRLKYDKEENYKQQDNGYQVTGKKDDVKQTISKEKENKFNGKTGVTKPKTQLKSDSKSVKEENRLLKSQLTCRVCMDKSNNTVFLPCGHLVTCELCSVNVTKCPICRSKIQARIKAFVG